MCLVVDRLIPSLKASGSGLRGVDSPINRSVREEAQDRWQPPFTILNINFRGIFGQTARFAGKVCSHSLALLRERAKGVLEFQRGNTESWSESVSIVQGGQSVQMLHVPVRGFGCVFIIADN